MRPRFLYNNSMFVLSILILTIPYGFISYYIGRRILQTIKSFIINFNSKIYWIIFWIIDYSYIAVRIFGELLPSIILKYFTTIGAYWLGIMVYFILLWIVRDLFIFIVGKKLKSKTERFEKIKKVSGTMVIILAFLIVICGAINAVHPRVHHYEVNINKSAGSYKNLHVVMISDIHLGTIINNSRLQKLIDSTNMLHPDIVLLPGDVIDEDVAPFVNQKMKDTFMKLHSKLGCYAVLGNHEYAGRNQNEIIKKLEEANVTVLKDKYMKIDDSFYIVGRDDFSGNRKREDLDKLMGGIEKSFPIILMDHQPKKIKESIDNGIDLQLSGHTHAGQIFPGNIITKMEYEDYWGYLKKSSLQVIVSSGYGTWGPPIRTGNYPEIVDIVVHFKD